MASVTQRIKQIKQPYGGYINPRTMKKIQLEDDIALNENENINAGLIGMAVDYMTRFMKSKDKQEAFKISLMGAKIADEFNNAMNLLESIEGLDNKSIISSCKLVGYDVCFRAGMSFYKPVKEIKPNDETIENIRIMVQRSLNFFEKYGEVIKDGITFFGGYTSIIDSGDADFITKDTLWDFKVSKNEPTKEQTLQLLIYYLMGKHSVNAEFEDITKIGMFNPRKNVIYLKEISEISKDIIKEVEQNVIGYKNSYNVNENVENNRTKNVINKNENLLSMVEIMKCFGCTRYMVMKYYSEDGLPLVKIKNKYYIDKYDLASWLEEREKRRKEQTKNMIVGFLVTIVSIVIFFFILMSIL